MKLEYNLVARLFSESKTITTQNILVRYVSGVGATAAAKLFRMYTVASRHLPQISIPLAWKIANKKNSHFSQTTTARPLLNCFLGPCKLISACAGTTV